MSDVFSRWFLQDAEAVVSATRAIQHRHGNNVIAYIECRDYYQALAHSIAITQGGRAHFVDIACWGFDEKTPLDPPVAGQKTIGDLLKEVSRRGVTVRALIWAHPENINRATVKWFGELQSGGAIHDDRTLLYLGVHHQKFVVVRNAEGLVGYCGGMDVASNRLKDGPLNRPWHDVQLRIVGDAAVDVWQTFYDRWLEQASLAVGERGIDRPLYPPKPASAGSGQSVQILRTFGNGSNHLGLNINKNQEDIKIYGPFRRQSRAYQFAPSGERSVYRLLIKAIRATRTSIYLEDQYLVASEDIQGEPSLCWELAKALSRPSFKGMIILTTDVGTIQEEQFQVNYRRSRFWNLINLFGQRKVSVWKYKEGPTSAYWLHSKTWIFDDALAVVGSANCSRRDYSHDSNIAAAVLDAYAAENLPFAHDLRIRLWMKHLNSRKTRVTRDMLIDFASGIKYWVDSNDTDLAELNLTAGDPYHPDHSILDPPSGEPSREGWQNAFRQVRNELGMLQRKDWRDFEWDSLIDPDGS
jgi:phosphatidylserine/phosphatidylglycerophosphate/cardiolipin synthase-like enzyme